MKRKPQSTQSLTTAIVSDIHFNKHHVQGWLAFCEWVSETMPHRIVLAGDLIDAESLSRYDPTVNTPTKILPELRTLVKWVRWLRERCDHVVILPGNHDERLTRAVKGNRPQALKGVPGLSFREICQRLGVPDDVQWIEETRTCDGLHVGGVTIRHGHNQAGRFGGGKHLAANAITKSMGQSQVFGHHHRAQLFTQRYGSRNAYAISNPSLTADHAYAGNRTADWQRGFTILEEIRRDWATPHLVLMDDRGVFAINGRVYGVSNWEPEFEVAA